MSFYDNTRLVLIEKKRLSWSLWEIQGQLGSAPNKAESRRLRWSTKALCTCFPVNGSQICTPPSQDTARLSASINPTNATDFLWWVYTYDGWMLLYAHSVRDQILTVLSLPPLMNQSSQDDVYKLLHERYSRHKWKNIHRGARNSWQAACDILPGKKRKWHLNVALKNNSQSTSELYQACTMQKAQRAKLANINLPRAAKYISFCCSSKEILKQLIIYPKSAAAISSTTAKALAGRMLCRPD